MWIFTNQGFYSVVAHRDEPDTLLIRARDENDLRGLQKFIPELEVVEMDNADYRYRAFVSRAEWEAALITMTRSIDYANFKDEVKAKQGADRASVYMRVWSALLALQPPRSSAWSDWSDDWHDDDLWHIEDRRLSPMEWVRLKLLDLRIIFHANPTK